MYFFGIDQLWDTVGQKSPSISPKQDKGKTDSFGKAICHTLPGAAKTQALIIYSYVHSEKYTSETKTKNATKALRKTIHGGSSRTRRPIHRGTEKNSI